MRLTSGTGSDVSIDLVGLDVIYQSQSAPRVRRLHERVFVLILLALEEGLP